MGKVDSKNIHSGHRKRVKENVIKNGFSQLEEHKLLELMLFYSIPRGDTNELAHKLLNEFGSLDELFKASPDRLKRVEGVGDNTSVMIGTVGELFFRMSKAQPIKKRNYKSVTDLKELSRSNLNGEKIEKIILFCFDSSWRLKKSVVLSSGNENTATMDICKIVQTVLDTSAPVSVIAHNHPTSVAEPSAADIDATRNVSVMLRKLGFSLADHIIVGEDGDTYSMYSDPAYRGLFY